jgi:hypothetical protein
MCEQQYFIEYVLGWRGPSNQKADKGTIVHKVLEILAFIKKATQENQKAIDDDIAGKINIKKYNIETIFDLVYKHYTNNNSHHIWKEKDKTDCLSWVYKTLEFNGGMFDPRNRDIVCPEQRFDFTIDKPWAKYAFNTDEGRLEGNLALKGTIDLITKIDDNFYEIIDWKTGKRLNWATGKQKTQECLENDPQLRIYHYAVSHLYPHVDNIMITINYINDGGPFSMCFQKSDLIKTEYMLRDKFEKIKSVKRPYLNKSWMCKKLCHFGKTTFENTEIKPLEEYRDNQTTNKGDIMCKCEQISHDVQLLGIDEAVQLYKHPNHSFGFYKPPGE